MKKFEKKVISTDLIFLDQEFNNQDQVIQFIVKNAEFLNYIKDAATFYEAVKRREEEIPTAIGYDIAIPHGKDETVKTPFIAFVRTKDTFQWTNKTTEKVRLIFLIGIPKESEGKLHLKFISQLSKKLLDADFRNKLLTQINKEQIFSQLASIET